MTRVNVGINPKYLTDQHLIAEIKEIPQLLGQLSRSLKQGTAELNIPEQFTLGRGHVKFFYNKLLYLERRFLYLKEEAYIRGFKIKVTLDLSDYPDWCLGDYVESSRDVIILKERIYSKLVLKPQYYRYKRLPFILQKLLHFYSVA